MTQPESETNESTRGEGAHGGRADAPRVPRLVACLLLLPKESEPILQALQKLMERDPESSSNGAITKPEGPGPSTSLDCWLGHLEAAAYLGVSTSTLYHYSCHGQIERRKLGRRLEYRRSVLDEFKQAHILPATHSALAARIIPSAHSSGK